MCKSNKIQCPRCGGSGKVEHTHIVEGVCFMCGGFGEVFPKRVGELTERAKVRKANREAKKQKQLEEAKKREEIYWENVYNEITKRNIEFYNNYKCSTSEGAMAFYRQIKGLANALGLDKNSTKNEVIEMFNDYFNNDGRMHNFKIEVSKLCEKYFGFMYISLDGRDRDLTDCMHEVQNLIKY